MATPSDYKITRLPDGRLRLDRAAEPSSTAIAYAKPLTDRTGSITGWQLHPIVVVQGSRSKTWPDAARALASTKLMSAAALRRLISDALASANGGAAP